MVELVITAALKAELPLEWLRSRGVPCLTLRALQSGALGKRGPGAGGQGGGHGMLVVITGVGPDASRRAASLIRDRVQPKWVVNLGSACSLGDPTLARGSWVLPTTLYPAPSTTTSTTTTTSSGLMVPPLPFAWPRSLPVHLGGSCLTVSAPIVEQGGCVRTDRDQRQDNLPAPCETDGTSLNPRLTPFSILPAPSPNPVAIADMECAAQAEVFAQSGIAFSVLKMITDGGGSSAHQQHQELLPRLRSEVRQILSFLDLPSNRPEVAVIIPVFNRRDWILRALASVEEQRLPPQEVIVVDDGSTDGTGELVSDWIQESGLPRVQLITRETNGGVSAARNLGTSRTASPWICFLDSDDQWHPDKLANQWAFHQRHPYYLWSQTEEIWIRHGQRVNQCKHHTKQGGWIWEPSLDRCLITPSAVMIHRSLFELHGGFDERFRVCEDYDLWLRMTRHHPVGLDSSQTVTKYGGHPDQLSRTTPAMDRFRVAALWKAWVTEGGGSTSSLYEKQLAQELIRRLEILTNGSRKRGKDLECKHYQNIAQAVLSGRPCLALPLQPKPLATEVEPQPYQEVDHHVHSDPCPVDQPGGGLFPLPFLG